MKESRDKFALLIVMAKAQKWDEIERLYPSEWIRYGKVLKSQYWTQTLAKDIPQAQHLWLYGGSHTGKSSIIKLLFPDIFYKRPDEWWDGYTDQETVYLGDMDPPSFQKCGMNNLKVWADPQGFSANKKYGGSDHIVLHQVLVTSNFRIVDCMRHDLQGFGPILQALMNRYKEINIEHYLFQHGIRLRPDYQLKWLLKQGNTDYAKIFEYIDPTVRSVHLHHVDFPLAIVPSGDINKVVAQNQAEELWKKEIDDVFTQKDLDEILDDVIEFNTSRT